MSTLYRGRVWKFGDDVNTDLIMPGEAMYGKVPAEQVKDYAFKNVRPEFSKEVRPGDLVVGGQNFGCGSSRPACRVLKELGVSIVVAESFAQIFFRNSINLGFPLLVCPHVLGLLQDGDRAQVDPLTGHIVNLENDASLEGERLPPFIVRLIEVGGILALLKEGKRLQSEPT